MICLFSCSRGYCHTDSLSCSFSNNVARSSCFEDRLGKESDGCEQSVDIAVNAVLTSVIKRLSAFICSRLPPKDHLVHVSQQKSDVCLCYKPWWMLEPRESATQGFIL